MSRWWRRRGLDQPAGSGRPSAPTPSPLLPGLKATLDELLAHEDSDDAVFTAEQEADRESAARAFRAAGPSLLDAATPYLWDYYESFVAEFTQEQRRDYGLPTLGSDTDIWTQVSFTVPPNIELGHPPLAPARTYISFEGEVSWEPEHGLQLVFEEGRRVCKVGPYDGHVTNAHAYADISLLDVVFK